MFVNNLPSFLRGDLVSHMKSVFKIARGAMAGIDAGVVLSAKQCIEIGHQAIAQDYHYQAVEWIGTALTKIRHQNDTTASLTGAEIQFETAKKVVCPVLNFGSKDHFTSSVSIITDI